MKRATLWTVLVALCSFVIAGCGGSSGLRVEITTAPTSLAAGSSSNVVATVFHDHDAGGVNWSCQPVGACGSFDPTQTASGAASVYTAPSTVPSGGIVQVTATSVDKPSKSATANISISAVATQNFVFYATGEQDTEDQYSIAGVVAIASDGSGDVLTGEQDYNDGDGHTSPQPSGDTITGGSLALADDGSGNGILTLYTNNSELPNGGTEIFAVAFTNTSTLSHALIIQFDGTATSSGSFDLQTTTTAPVSASFAFTANGADEELDPLVEGGQFVVDSSGNISGVFDVNDSGNVTLGTAIPDGVSIGEADSFGRGALIGALDGTTSVNYYMVSPEVIRTIDVDTTDTAVGSAYGQGTGTFSSASIPQSVFSLGNSLTFYGAVGQFYTFAEAEVASATAPVRDGAAACSGTGTCSFLGTGDLNDFDHGHQLPAQHFNGTYIVGTNGYGSMSFDETFGNVTTLGIYAVDPTLNILDPSNTTDGLGGALIAEMDSNLVGTGSIVPQTDVTQASFAGTYVFGGQGDTSEGDEFDFLGVGTAVEGDGSTALSGTGALGDPAGALTGSGVTSTNATYNATFTPDDANPGRYTTLDSSLTIAASNDPPDFNAVSLAVTAYQAYGGQLFWVDMDSADYFVGSLEQVPGSASDAKKAQAKAKLKKH